MSRLAAVKPADATVAQREVIDAITGGARGKDRALDSLLDERGGLAGPFNAWVHRPDLGIVAQSLGERLRFQGTLPGAAREIAILTVGAKWMAEYEWWAHTRVGLYEGMSDGSHRTLGPPTASARCSTIRLRAGRRMTSPPILAGDRPSGPGAAADATSSTLRLTAGWGILPRPRRSPSTRWTDRFRTGNAFDVTADGLEHGPYAVRRASPEPQCSRLS